LINLKENEAVMNTRNRSQLKLEKLESRWLPSGIWQGVDVDGDLVSVKLNGPGELDVLTSEVDQGLQIDNIAVFDTTHRSKLIIKAKRSGGDGYVDVNEIDADTEVLHRISVDGNLGYLTAGALSRLEAFTSQSLDGGDADWLIDSDVKNVQLKGSLEFGQLHITGDLNRAVIKGDIYNASLLVDETLRNLRVWGDVAEDALVSALGEIHKVTIDGFLDYATVESGDQLKNINVGLDILDAEIFAGWDIRSLRVDGSVIGSSIESEAWIRKIDVWDMIETSEIFAGPEGINTIFAYDISDTTLAPAGNIRHILLDADMVLPQVQYHDYIIEDIFYWPVYEEIVIVEEFFDPDYAEEIYVVEEPYYDYHNDRSHFSLSFGDTSYGSGFSFHLNL
jgi:hypothetical protein